jgi:hypothetical protein
MDNVLNYDSYIKIYEDEINKIKRKFAINAV